MAKFTKEQIKLLARQMLAKKDSGRPFNLLTGAGCSKSAGIPLAAELVKEIQKSFSDECNHHLEEHQMSDYGACMSCLGTNERRELLSKYLDNPKINWAHIAIASLMHAGFVSRVITFNFDSILARACSLLGLYPATYDFAAAATVDTDYIAHQAIIHLHGQGSGKSLLNSDEETKEHAENIRPLIRATFQDSPLLVIGYSGSSDAVFPVIYEEYKGRERLWWAGYSENPDTPVANLIQKNNKVSYYLGGCDADEFLIELAKELKCFPPTLFRDPYGHLLSELEPVTEFPLTKSESSDLLTNLKNQLIKSQQQFNSDQNIPELIMKGEWNKVIQLGDTKNKEHIEYLAWAYTMLGNELSNEGIIKIKEDLIEQSLEKYQQAITIKPDMYEALTNWGIALSVLAKLKNSDSLFQQSFEKHKQAITIKPDYHDAYNNWGVVLSDYAKLKNDESLFQQSFEKYQQALTIKPDCYAAFNNWGNAQHNLGKIKGDNTLLQKSLEKYQSATALRPDYYEAFYNWGTSLSELAKRESDEALFQQSFAKYKQAIAIKPNYYEAFNNWGVALLDLARLKSNEIFFQQSIEKYQQAIIIKPDYYEAFNNWGIALSELAKRNNDESLFQKSFEKYHQSIAIKHDYYEAFKNWGDALSELDRQQNEETIFQQSVEKYQAAVTIKPDYYEALYNWGYALFDLAKRKKDENLFQKSIEKYQQATVIKPDYHEAFYNWGSALSELATLKSDEIVFQQSIEKYQKSLAIKPDQYDVFDNWGTALSELAQIRGDEALFQQAFEKYQQAIKIKPDFNRAFNNWGAALIGAFQLTGQKKYLEKAYKVLAEAEKLNPDKVYNLACAYSLLNEKDKCKEKLWHCYAKKTLPSKANLVTEKDLENVRTEPWFEALINNIDT